MSFKETQGHFQEVQGGHRRVPAGHERFKGYQEVPGMFPRECRGIAGEGSENFGGFHECFRESQGHSRGCQRCFRESQERSRRYSMP